MRSSAFAQQLCNSMLCSQRQRDLPFINLERTYDQAAEKAKCEPKVLDAALCTNVSSLRCGQKRKNQLGFCRGLVKYENSLVL
jgi:hypothetical protein